MLGVLLQLLLLGNSVDQTGNESNENRGDGPEVDGGIEENQTGQGNWQLVQSTNHRVGGGRSHSNTPSRAVRNTDRRGTREDHGKNGGSSVGCREVLCEVLGRPVLKQKGGHQQHRDRQQVVVVHGVEVLEVGQLDSDSHEQHETGRGETVGEHPEVTQVHSVQILGGLLLSAVTVGGKNRGENHQKERAQGHGSDLTTEPQDLTVSDQDNGQVLEDRVDWDRQVSQGLGAGVDHGNQQKSDWHPLSGLILVELSVGNKAKTLQGSDGENTHGRLHSQKQKVQVERVSRKNVLVGDGHQDRGSTVTQNRQRTGVSERRSGTSAHWGVTVLVHFLL